MSVFGKEFKDKHFSFESGVTNLNHGSFGKAPDIIMEKQFQDIRQFGAFADKYIRYDLPGPNGHIAESRKAIARLLDSELENLVLVQNATTAFNAVMRSWPFKRGDKIVYYSITYDACVNTLRFLRETVGVELVCIHLDFPTTYGDIVVSTAKTLDAHPETKLLVMDLVASMPSTRMPYERLVQLCRERGILSFVDGAHGIGLVPISLKTVRPDFLTTNLHKWMYGVHSAAAFYVDPAHHSKVASLPVSAKYFPPTVEAVNRLAESFQYVGTLDYTAQQVIVDLAKFHEDAGGLDKVIEYQNDLSQRASALVCKGLGVSELTDFGPEFRCAMFTTSLPLDVPEEQQTEFIFFMFKFYISKWKTYIPLAPYNGKIYMRWSAAVYLELEDFELGINATKEGIEQWKAKTYR